MIEDQIKSMQMAGAVSSSPFSFLQKIVDPLQDLHDYASQVHRRIRPQRMVSFFKEAEASVKEGSSGRYQDEIKNLLKDMAKKSGKGISREGFSADISEDVLLQLRGQLEGFEGEVEDFFNKVIDDFIEGDLDKSTREFLQEELILMMVELEDKFEEFGEGRVEDWEDIKETALSALKDMADKGGRVARSIKSDFDGGFDFIKDNLVGLATYVEAVGISDMVKGMAEEEASYMEQHRIMREMLGLTAVQYAEDVRGPMVSALVELQDEYGLLRGAAIITEDLMSDAMMELVEEGYIPASEELVNISTQLMEMQIIHEAATDIPMRSMARLIERYEEGEEMLWRYSDALEYLSRQGVGVRDIQEEGWAIFEQVDQVLSRLNVTQEEYLTHLEQIPIALGALESAELDSQVFMESFLEIMQMGSQELAETQKEWHFLLDEMDIQEMQEALREGEYLAVLEDIASGTQDFAEMESSARMEIVKALGIEEEMLLSLSATVKEGRTGREALLEHMDKLVGHTEDAEGAGRDFLRNIRAVHWTMDTLVTTLEGLSFRIPIVSDLMMALTSLDLSLQDVAYGAVVFTTIVKPIFKGLWKWLLKPLGTFVLAPGLRYLFNTALPFLGNFLIDTIMPAMKGIGKFLMHTAIPAMKGLMVYIGPKGWIVLGAIALAGYAERAYDLFSDMGTHLRRIGRWFRTLSAPRWLEDTIKGFRNLREQWRDLVEDLTLRWEYLNLIMREHLYHIPGIQSLTEEEEERLEELKIKLDIISQEITPRYSPHAEDYLFIEETPEIEETVFDKIIQDIVDRDYLEEPLKMEEAVKIEEVLEIEDLEIDTAPKIEEITEPEEPIFIDGVLTDSFLEDSSGSVSIGATESKEMTLSEFEIEDEVPRKLEDFLTEILPDPRVFEFFPEIIDRLAAKGIDLDPLVDISADDYLNMVRMMYAEAGGEPFLGQIGVGATIISRMLASGFFPDDLYGVISQRVGDTYQYSPYGDGSFQRLLGHDIEDFSADMHTAAILALLGEQPWDEEYGREVMWFMHPGLADPGGAGWFATLQKVWEKGHHVFYRSPEEGLIEEVKPDMETKVYTVGDYIDEEGKARKLDIWDLAYKHGTVPEVLLELNEFLEDVRDRYLEEGTELIVPAGYAPDSLEFTDLEIEVDEDDIDVIDEDDIDVIDDFITHIVTAGETLSGIAEEYGVEMSAIVEATEWMKDPDLIFADRELIIPVKEPVHREGLDKNLIEDLKSRQKAEEFYIKRYEEFVDHLIQQRNILESIAEIHDRSFIVHEIKEGDILGEIAGMYEGVSVTDIVEATDWLEDEEQIIFPGEELIVPFTSRVEESIEDTSEVLEEFKVHVIEAGDTLWDLARENEVAVEAIIKATKWLKEEEQVLPLGAELRIPKYKKGGVVPGYGQGDSVLILAEPGEVIIPKEQVQEGMGGVLDWFQSEIFGESSTRAKIKSGGEGELTVKHDVHDVYVLSDNQDVVDAIESSTDKIVNELKSLKKVNKKKREEVLNEKRKRMLRKRQNNEFPLWEHLIEGKDTFD